MIRRLLILALLLLSSCRKPAPPPPPKADAPLIVSVGGLGSSQMESFDAAVTTNFPGASLARFGPENGYLGSIAGYVLSHEHGPAIVLAGHSFGADRICRDAVWMGDIRLVLLLDPVCSTPGESEMTVPANVRRCIVFRRGRMDIERQATVHGVIEEIIINANHNDLPHNPETLRLSMEAIKGAL